MKEAIGGTWLYGIVLVFVVLFTTFISISTNYSRCFRLKDEIITTIEHYNGVNYKSINTINEYLNGIGYASTGDCPENTSEEETWYGFMNSTTCSKDGTCNSSTTKDVNYCIKKFTIVKRACLTDDKKVDVTGAIGHPRSAYYQVVVFFKLNWPIINSLFNIHISGETGIIYNWNDQAIIPNKSC